ncbi:unnamed protein product [Camellia sinensis]
MYYHSFSLLSSYVKFYFPHQFIVSSYVEFYFPHQFIVQEEKEKARELIMTIPLGFKFFPSDQELIHYLLQKSTARPLPCDNVIKDYDLYGEKEPSTIFDGAEANIHYIFTILKKKTKKGARVDRTAGTGTWKGVDASKPIYDGNRRLIGSKKNFVYLTKSKTKGGWNMAEYNLEGIAEKHALKLGKITDYVICRVTKNAISKNRIREEGQVMLRMPEQEEMEGGPPISKEINNTTIRSTSGAYQVVEYLDNRAYMDTGSAMVSTMAMLPAPQQIEGGPTMVVPSSQEINNTFSDAYQVEEHLANSAYADIGSATAQLASYQEMKEGPPISQENNRMIIGSTSGTYQAEEHAHTGTESIMAQLPSSSTPPLSNAPQPSMDMNMMMGFGRTFDLDIDMFLANALEPSSGMMMGFGSAFNQEDIDSFLAY